METLYAIGMMVGMMQARAEPPKPAVEPPAIERQAVAEKPRHPHKKSDWPLSY
jgi:hypothetical protein